MARDRSDKLATGRVQQRALSTYDTTRHTTPPSASGLPRLVSTSFLTRAQGSVLSLIFAYTHYGYSDLWLASKACKRCPGGIATFDPKASSTYSSAIQPFSLKYVGGTVSGILGSDNVSFPSTSSLNATSFTIPKQTFGVMDDIPDGLIDPHVSGVLGLAFQSLASTKSMPAWEALVKAGAWTEPLMSFYFTRHANGQDTHGDWVRLEHSYYNYHPADAF